jgi:hypothetical protein
MNEAHIQKIAGELKVQPRHTIRKARASGSVHRCA